MKRKEKMQSKGKEGEGEDKKKRKRTERGREREREEGEVGKEGEEDGKRMEEAGTTIRATMGPDRPTRARLRGCPGLRRTAGRTARSAHLELFRSVSLLSSACFPSAAAWTAACPARATAAPR